MRTIDIHAHLMPQRFWQTVDQGQEWYGVRYEQADDRGWTVSPAGRNPVLTPKLRFTPEERLRDMDEQRVDVQVISVATPLFGYYLDASQARQLAREVNDDIAAMTRQWPDRFAGLATLPAQEVGAAIEELDRGTSHGDLIAEARDAQTAEADRAASRGAELTSLHVHGIRINGEWRMENGEWRRYLRGYDVRNRGSVLLWRYGLGHCTRHGGWYENR